MVCCCLSSNNSLNFALAIVIDQQPPNEPWLKERFIILKSESEEQEWSQYDNNDLADDDESVISIHSQIH